MPTIRENLLALHGLLTARPEEKINLDAYTQTTPCGTLHCSLGWACTAQHFQAQGLFLKQGRPFLRLAGEVYDVSALDRLLDPLFGGDAWRRLFAPTVDRIFSVQDVNHKDVALARIEHQLTHYPE